MLRRTSLTTRAPSLPRRSQYPPKQTPHVVWFSLDSWYWGPFFHLRIFLILKFTAFVFGAIQLKVGLPRGSVFKSYEPVFASIYHPYQNVLGWWVMLIYTNIPFLFELRHALDWVCSTTTLKLTDWLVLEDVHLSLFNAQFDRNVRHFRHVGREEPAWRKWLQGVSMFFGLCLLIWLPPLLFAGRVDRRWWWWLRKSIYTIPSLYIYYPPPPPS